MPIWKESYTFVLGGKQWDYVFYRSTQFTADAYVRSLAGVEVIPGEPPAAANLLQRLRRLHVPECRCHSVSVARVRDVFGETYAPEAARYAFASPEPGLSHPGNAAANLRRPDITNAAVKILLSGEIITNPPFAAGLRKRLLNLSGQPDTWVRRHPSTGAPNLDSGELPARLGELGTLLRDYGYLILAEAPAVQVSTGTPAVEIDYRWKSCTGIGRESVLSGLRNNTVVTIPGHTFAAGDRVKFSVPQNESQGFPLKGIHEVMRVIVPVGAVQPGIVINTRYWPEAATFPLQNVRVRRHALIAARIGKPNDIVNYPGWEVHSLGVRQRGGRHDEGGPGKSAGTSYRR